MKNNILIFGFFFLIFSCCQNAVTYNEETIIEWDDFEEISLIGNELEFDAEIMKPYQLIVYDSILMTVNENTSHICHIFNLTTHRKIGERITIGQGPNEMIHPFFINSDDSLMLFDPMSASVYTYSIDNFIKSSDVSPSCKIKLSEVPFFGELSKYNNGLIGVSYRPDAPCYVFDDDGSKLSNLGTYPERNKRDYSEMELVSAYRSIAATDGKDRVVVCHMFTDLIDFYANNGILLKRIFGPEQFFTNFTEYRNNDRIVSLPDGNYYRDAFYSPLCVDGKLYVLYNGKFVTDSNYDLLASNLLVFDLDGNPLYHYRLDKGVLRITIDSKKRKIYGISNKPDYHIIEYSY